GSSRVNVAKIKLDVGRRCSWSVIQTLSLLEPKLSQMMPLVVNLNTDPDRILIALGLNFDPAHELKRLSNAQQRLPSSSRPELAQGAPSGISVQAPAIPSKPIVQKDEECTGIRRRKVVGAAAEGR
ncbi:MAG: DUF5331 domain-containing protein, partial [Cyanobacteria bacterium J06607_6]